MGKALGTPSPAVDVLDTESPAIKANPTASPHAAGERTKHHNKDRLAWHRVNILVGANPPSSRYQTKTPHHDRGPTGAALKVIRLWVPDGLVSGKNPWPLER